MDKYNHLDMFEDPRVEIMRDTRTETSVTNVLQLTGLSVSGFVGITTMIMVMLAVAFSPVQTNQGPIVKGAAIARVSIDDQPGNIATVQDRYVRALASDDSFQSFPIQFRTVGDDVEFLSNEFEARGVQFTYDPENNNVAYVDGASVTTGDTEAAQRISMDFSRDTRKVGFHIQSGNGIDATVLRQARPVRVQITDALGTMVYDGEATTCPGGEALCAPEFIGFESNSLISNITLTTPYPFAFSIAGLYIETL